MIVIWFHCGVYGTKVGPPLVCLLILGGKEIRWNEFNKSSRGPGQLLTMQSAKIDYLSSTPSPCKGIRHLTVDVGEQNGFFPAVNRISYLTAYPTKLFTLYTAKWWFTQGESNNNGVPKIDLEFFSFSHENPSIGNQFRGFCHRQRWIVLSLNPFISRTLCHDADISQYSQRYQKSPVNASGSCVVPLISFTLMMQDSHCTQDKKPGHKHLGIAALMHPLFVGLFLQSEMFQWSVVHHVCIYGNFFTVLIPIPPI